MPGPGPRGQACLRDRRGSLVRRLGSRFRPRFLQAGAVAADGPFDRFAQVVPQMPPVSDLDRQRCALSCPFGVAPAAVPADDLHPGVGIEPGAEGFRGPLGQHVDRPAGFDVDQDGAVDVSLAQREVIDAEHQRSPFIRVGGGADQPYQRGAADCAGQVAGQPGAGPAAQGHRDCLQDVLQAAGPPAVPGGQARYLLGERGLSASGVAAEESADLQVNDQFPAAARGIGQLSLVAAVHPPRHHPAAGARCLAGPGPGQHMHRPARPGHALNGQAAQVRNQNSKSLKIARPT